jgi:hypothetical protein
VGKSGKPGSIDWHFEPTEQRKNMHACDAEPRLRLRGRTAMGGVTVQCKPVGARLLTLCNRVTPFVGFSEINFLDEVIIFLLRAARFSGGVPFFSGLVHVPR